MDDAPPGAPVDEQKQAAIDKCADDPKTRAEIRWEGEGGNPDPEDLTTGVFEAPDLEERPAER